MSGNKTAEEIVSQVFDEVRAGMSGWRDGIYTPSEDQFAEMAATAIERDRAQRDIYELIAEALDDRAEMGEERGGAGYGDPLKQRRAAEAIRNNEGDTAWDRFIGPMLDEIEEEYGR